MSAEHFQTFLTADARTAPDGRSAEWAESGTGWPRWLDEYGRIRRTEGERGWASVYLHAHNALEIVADTVAQDTMEGISGDLPDKREQAAAIVLAAAKLVRGLALDAACDGGMTDERWEQLLLEVRGAAKGIGGFHVWEGDWNQEEKVLYQEVEREDGPRCDCPGDMFRLEPEMHVVGCPWGNYWRDDR